VFEELEKNLGDFIPKNFEDLTVEEKKRVYEDWIKTQQEQKGEVKQKPLYRNYFPLGEGSGISVTLWSNSLQLQRREKEGDMWKTTQEIHLARNILEKLYIRLPRLFGLMREVENR